MHYDTHLRASVEGRKFLIMYCVEDHVEMAIADLGEGTDYYLTVTRLPGHNIDSMSTIQDLAPHASSIYLTIKRGDETEQIELLQDDGSLIPLFSDNVAEFNPNKVHRFAFHA